MTVSNPIIPYRPFLESDSDVIISDDEEKKSVAKAPKRPANGGSESAPATKKVKKTEDKKEKSTERKKTTRSVEEEWVGLNKAGIVILGGKGRKPGIEELAVLTEAYYNENEFKITGIYGILVIKQCMFKVMWRC